MTNLRLTIAMFILAAALAPALFVSWHSGQEAKQVQVSQVPIQPVKPPGFKTAPWEGVSTKRIDGQPPAAKPAPTTSPAPTQVQPATPVPAAPTTSPVVVELFTSEGCSSCPAADKVIGDLAAAQPADSNIYFLAYHVDYWDKLGWKDRFASKVFTDRQNAYAKAFDTTSVYTPQTIVGGEFAFVGSDKPNTVSVIDGAKSKVPTLSITAARPEIKPDQTIKIDCKLAPIGEAKVPAHIRICAALVEDGLSTSVKRGENEGRTLKHERVVRVFAEVSPSADNSGAIELKAPSDLKADKASVIVFVQDAKTMKIIAAAKAAPTKP
jgi:hypothetical protein